MTTIKSDLLYQYSNGDYEITLLSDGTLTRTSQTINPRAIAPTSLDIKITDYCDMGCAYCHESSTKQGLHGDLDFLIKQLLPLYKGTELALGGGNPLSHPDLLDFLSRLRELDLVPNLTINEGHLKPYRELINQIIDRRLAYGIGVSITQSDHTEAARLLTQTPNIVFHVIAGVHSPTIVDELRQLGNYCKILVLGYKDYGFGVNYRSAKTEKLLTSWYQQIHKYLGETLLSFDNLAIEQLNLQRFFTPQEWQEVYMGDDFTHTMYGDAVKQEWAPTSRSSDRQSMRSIPLLEYFASRY